MSDLFDLHTRVALVTGASKGLGREAALALAEAGADLVIGARTEADVFAAADEIASATTRSVMPCVLDVADPQSVAACVAGALERFGRIDILVNNAGVNVRAPLAEIRDEDFDYVQKVNVYGVMHCCRALAPHMVEAGYGRIINIGSSLSLVGLPHRVSYTASKGAVLQMTRTLAVELATTGVTVNAICPGPFATEINRSLLENAEMARFVLDRVPMGRWGRMREIRAPVVFLASEAASYVTGAVLSVDGGWVAQ